jgi:hypothetical protein
MDEIVEKKLGRPKNAIPTHRFSGYFPPDLFSQVQEMADNEKRPFNTQLIILVQAALKEKIRLREKSKRKRS